MDRTERQKIAVRKWINAKGKGTIVMPTGTGKTFTSILSIQAIIKKNPGIRILVVVPTTALKEQWTRKLDEFDISFNAEVQVINTVVKHQWICDYLIIDEIHRVASDLFKEVFNKVNYKLVMGLTATFERLDGKEFIIAKYCPVVDIVTREEAISNGWISSYKEYKVLIDVDDINVYKEFNKEWIEHFEFFDFSFDKAMKCVGPEGWKYKLRLLEEMYQGSDENKRKEILGAINYHAAGFVRTMQKRKAFINNHPKKIEIAKKIIAARPNSKIITFSNNVKMAEAIDNGNFVYTGKTSKAKSRVMMEDYISGKINRLHSCAKLNEGIDVPDISVGIVLGTDSSEIKAVQRLGRSTRLYENKCSEFFYIIIRDTVEEKWHQNSHKNNSNYITINEEGLDKVLNGEEPTTLSNKPTKQLMFRF